jgi:hypothetical protein
MGDDKMSRLGNTFIGATGQIDSQSLNVEELAQTLDGLLETGRQKNQAGNSPS